jgi:hypothetical protein
MRGTAAISESVHEPRQHSGSMGVRGLGGPEGNATLTMATAAVLFVLLAALGVTVVHMGGLEHLHMVLGLLLIPPVLLKMASTGYRMVRYYTGARPYREKGPPALPLRMLAPVLVAATVVVFASGVVLLADGHKVGIVLEVHKVSFIAWVALFGVHVLAYAPRVVRSLRTDWTAARRSAVPGAGLRATLVATTIGAGTALALTLLPAIDSYAGHGVH